MLNHVLFVCKSCNSASIQKGECKEGSLLLDELFALHQDWSRRSELEIQAVGCLWACNHPCVVAFSASDKYTYLFTDLPCPKIAPALLQFGEHYLDSEDGTILWKKFPELLQSVGMARIPPVPQG